ncbi:MAG TPA: nucleoside transporter C-terminal domain-containing protein, partial [Candidatus Sulfotelmatobacter sp.]|nr:nucleoside transporter C-terminal domain-containing protein [Candidatus Sulfotelmatobacter sp.]
MGRFTGILGLLTMLGLAYAFSTNRRAIRLKTVAWGLGLQIAFALFVLKADIGRRIFQAAGNAVNRLLSYSFEGSKFVFGELGKQGSSLGFYFAFQVLPTIIFIAAFFAVLYHFGVMQFIIKQVAKVMTRVMGASGAESLNVAASIFMGQTEAPLTIRPFLPDLTNSELMTVMTSGMAHVSGGIMAAYIAFGIDPKHLLSAVIMTAPGTLLMAKMLVPETEQPKTAGRVVMNEEEMAAEKSENLLGAISRGTTDGLHLSLNIAAMLISFLALIALTDAILGGVHNELAHVGIGWFPASMEKIFGVLFAPIAWLIGIPWHDCPIIGNLLGTRMVLNELVAFSMLGPQRGMLDPRSFTIATFALCGFANFSSIGIQIGGIGALAPNRKGDLARLGVRAM